ncbi:MAG: class I SAM-dependent methyltransferase, partial [Nanoarchaeota archaeon]|nr:class I SAM-dependent methyltransferase [Nanoarchaeota archaeon]
MDTEDYWKAKWENRESEAVNNFARRCFSWIKQDHATLLDLGCGDGRDSIYFAGKGLKVTAVDFSESGIARLKERISLSGMDNIQAIQKDIRKIRLKDNSFDIIYAHLSLHYFDDETTARLFGMIYRILNHRGQLFVKCKSTDDALYGKGENVGKEMYLKGHLRHFFTKRYMEEKLERFRILRIRKTAIERLSSR